MNTLKFKEPWLRELLPEGLPFPSSTVIEGPMGAGKPIIAAAFIKSWLEKGGNIISMPLQFPDPEYTKQNLKELYGLDLKDYMEQVVFVSLQPQMQGIQEAGPNHFQANMIEPENWTKVIELTKEKFSKDSDILFFSTALNLPLLAESKYEKLIDTLKFLFQQNSGLTYLFAVSSSMVANRVSQISHAADNLMEGHVTKDNNLRFRIINMKNAQYNSKEQQVPLEPALMENAAERAKKHRVAPVDYIKNTYQNI